MRIDIVARHFEISDKTREYIQQEVEHRLGAHYDRIVDCKMIVEKGNNVYIAEAIANVPGEQLAAKEQTEDLTKSIDYVVKKLQRQIVRHKDKWKTKGVTEK
jgi:putative sigma-54 modulation protein